MNNIFLFLGVSIVLISVNSLPTVPPTAVSDAVTKFCTTVTTKQNLATLYYNQLTTVLNSNQNAEKVFPNTLTYINDPNNKNALLTGGDSCKLFFAGLKTPLTTDLQQAGLPLQDAAQKITQYVDQIIKPITSVLAILQG